MKRLAASFVRSAQARHNVFQPLEDTRRWLLALQEQPGCRIERVPLSALDEWYFEAGTGNLRHRSGRFFSIRGLDCRPPLTADRPWQQPIICQPEVGILGILTKDVDGVRYFLMQAKMEPGNVNRVQLSPTVQATHSNYTQAHKGRLPPYLDYFLGARATVIRSQLQSETGTRFFRKFNNNILLDVTEDLELRPGFRWLTLHELQCLMALDDCVNMDSRSVLSGIPYGHARPDEDPPTTAFWNSLRDGGEEGDARDGALRAWLQAQRHRHAMATALIPLNQVRDWVLQDGEIRHLTHNYFTVTGVHVEAEDREVSRWSQPILRHEGLGLAGFLCAEIRGVLHFLIQAKPEPGIVGGVELGPTVSLFDYRARASAPGAPRYLEYFLGDGEVLHSSIQSEEGGRFWNLRNHFLVIRLASPDLVDKHERYEWLTLGELQRLSRGECVVNSEARTLLSCLPYFN